MQLRTFAIVSLAAIASVQVGAQAASTSASERMPPLDGWKSRFQWAASTSLVPERFAGMAISSAWSTGFNQPPEFGPHWPGFGKRMGVRVATGTLATFIEAGAGGLWREDPRYHRMGNGGRFKSRAGRVLTMAVMNRTEDGKFTPAYGRWIALPAANMISNGWRPESERTAARTFSRIPMAFAGQAVANAFTEFWPEIRRHVFRIGK